MPRLFRTSDQIERYFGGETIRCLLCGKRFRRLVYHLAVKHDINTDEYKARFGLPWTRGLTSGASHRSSGWTKRRRAQARQAALRRRIFDLAYRGPRKRALAPYQSQQSIEHLGAHMLGYGKTFDKRVRALFDKGLTDELIARKLEVNRMTVNKRTKQWRKSQPMKRRRVGQRSQRTK